MLLVAAAGVTRDFQGLQKFFADTTNPQGHASLGQAQIGGIVINAEKTPCDGRLQRLGLERWIPAQSPDQFGLQR